MVSNTTRVTNTFDVDACQKRHELAVLANSSACCADSESEMRLAANGLAVAVHVHETMLPAIYGLLSLQPQSEYFSDDIVLAIGELLAPVHTY